MKLVNFKGEEREQCKYKNNCRNNRCRWGHEPAFFKKNSKKRKRSSRPGPTYQQLLVQGWNDQRTMMKLYNDKNIYAIKSLKRKLKLEQQKVKKMAEKKKLKSPSLSLSDCDDDIIEIAPPTKKRKVQVEEAEEKEEPRVEPPEEPRVEPAEEPRVEPEKEVQIKEVENKVEEKESKQKDEQ